MKQSSPHLGRCARLALLLLMLAAQGVAVAHDIGDNHPLNSDPCVTCIIGHGLGSAVSASYEAPPLQVCQTFAAIRPIAATLISRTTCHFARAPPNLSWNTVNPN